MLAYWFNEIFIIMFLSTVLLICINVSSWNEYVEYIYIYNPSFSYPTPTHMFFLSHPNTTLHPHPTLSVLSSLSPAHSTPPNPTQLVLPSPPLPTRRHTSTVRNPPVGPPHPLHKKTDFSPNYASIDHFLFCFWHKILFLVMKYEN